MLHPIVWEPTPDNSRRARAGDSLLRLQQRHTNDLVEIRFIDAVCNMMHSLASSDIPLHVISHALVTSLVHFHAERLPATLPPSTSTGKSPPPCKEPRMAKSKGTKKGTKKGC